MANSPSSAPSTTPPAERLVVVLCGPPGAGKTTVARTSGLEVFDRDDPQWSGEAEFRRALRRLAEDPHARAVVIRSGATSSARSAARRLVGATHCYLLRVDERTARERVQARERGDKVHVLAGLPKWYADFDHADRVEGFPGWRTVLAGPQVGPRSRSW
ncbi:hypothetical protein ACIRON_02785 [Nocardioides sp. NPDC101246]|uniref:hypothetical protein n=1 Tax=Nocardioides sp. NPDC101246 TaxID=3364336 RepID=UPI0037F4AC01